MTYLDDRWELYKRLRAYDMTFAAAGSLKIEDMQLLIEGIEAGWIAPEVLPTLDHVSVQSAITFCLVQRNKRAKDEANDAR